MQYIIVPKAYRMYIYIKGYTDEPLTTGKARQLANRMINMYGNEEDEEAFNIWEPEQSLYEMFIEHSHLEKGIRCLIDYIEFDTNGKYVIGFMTSKDQTKPRYKPIKYDKL